MRRFPCVLVVMVLGLAGALVGVVPDGLSAVAARKECSATAFVTKPFSGTVSTIDVKARTKHPDDITVGPGAGGVAITPDGNTAFVTQIVSGTVSTIDVKARLSIPPTSPSARTPAPWRSPPDGKTAFINDRLSGTTSTIDVKTRTKHPDDIPVRSLPYEVAVTPCRR